jgi:hypothetical protein
MRVPESDQRCLPAGVVWIEGEAGVAPGALASSTAVASFAVVFCPDLPERLEL